MKLEDLKLKEVKKLANDAISDAMSKYSKDVHAYMIKMGELEKKYQVHVFDEKGYRTVNLPSNNTKFFVYAVDFIPNDDYENEEFEVYGARGNYSDGCAIGPASFILLWNGKNFKLDTIVFDTHPFSLTEKRIEF